MQRQLAAAAAHRARLVAHGQEASSDYGRALFVQHGQALADGLDALLTRFVLNPAIAGPHYQALPLLLHFAGRGIRPVVAVTLTHVLNRISGRHPHRRLCIALGRAIEEEVRAQQLERRDPDLLRVVLRHSGKAEAISPYTLRALQLPADQWTAADRFELGALLLDQVVAATGIVQVVHQLVRGRRQPIVEASTEVLQQIRSTPLDPLPERQTPCISPPAPWEAYQGLVKRRDGLPLDYLDHSSARPLAVVNHLQRQPVTIDPWMAELQRQAWDGNIRGLFKVNRDPAVAPPRPEDNRDRRAWAEWRRLANRAWIEERTNAAARRRIEASISQAEQLIDRPLWFRYEMDFRGRLYTANRITTHQGPDHDKALIQLAGEPCDVDGADWILKAAAGHYGLGRDSWADRLRWGQQNAQRLVAVAEAPLDQLELWRDAADPWQFLQLARAWHQWVMDPSTPIGAPVRLDQTTSGLGIAAALVRDVRLARETNLIGDTRHDIYRQVAEQVTQQLRMALEAGAPRDQRHAALWLELGVDRSLTKEPVIAAIYGGRFQSLLDGLADHLREALPVLEAAQYQQAIVQPARYLAQVLSAVLRPELQPLLELRDWLRGISATVVKRQIPLQWTAPSGLVVMAASRQPAHAPARTLLHGSRGWETEDSDRRRGELSALASNRSITANLVHSFDAALAHAVICRAAGVGVPLLTNHDCFATVPARAGWLHQQLHQELRALYQPDWLSKIHREIADGSGVSGLKPPPLVGTLAPQSIGENPHCFS